MFYTPSSAAADFESVLKTLDPQKWVSRLSEVLFLRKSCFLDQIRFWMDFWWILDGFGSRFGHHFGIKIASKNRSKNRSDFGWNLEGFGLPIGVHFGSILASKIDQKSRSIFERKRDWTVEGVGGRGGAQEGPFFRAKIDIFRHRLWQRILHADRRTWRVLRRIEHAARNTAAAPLWRSSFLEWPSRFEFCF